MDNADWGRDFNRAAAHGGGVRAWLVMTGIDGKEYASDTWYPYPFMFEGLSMLPFRSDSFEAQYLFLRVRGDTVRHWGPWNYDASVPRPTHWCVRMEGWYEI